MAIHYVRVKGRIKDGKIVIDLPENVVEGDIEVQLPVTAPESELDGVPFTEEEIAQALRPHPKTGAEIAQNPAIGSWADVGITDSSAWVAEQRRRRKAKHQW
jgi:methyl coenzyme M reductase subunit C-like uncharacterized protein (methanogenesis marker protein 7)